MTPKEALLEMPARETEAPSTLGDRARELFENKKLARELVQDKTRLNQVLDLVEDRKKKELKELLGPTYQTIIEQAYVLMVDYNQDF